MRDFIEENKILVIIFSILFLTEIVVGTLYLQLKKKRTNNNLVIPQKESIISNTQPTSEDDLNILVMGMGGEGHPGGTLADSITLVNVNPKTSYVNIISIPRDLWVDIATDFNNTTKHKINEAYAIGIDDSVKYPNKKPEFEGKMGGGNLAKYTTAEVTGLKPDYFLAIDFNSFEEIIDILGGIKVDVKKPFDDYFYPVKGLENETCGFSNTKIGEFHQKYSGFQLEKQFTCRYEHLHFEKGNVEMDGKTALKYVRSRHSDQYGGDFARSERQHEMFLAIKDKIISIDILNKGNPLLEKLHESITTDFDLGLIKEILEPLGNITQYKTNHIFLSEENILKSSKSSSGQYILIATSPVKKYLQENIK